MAKTITWTKMLVPSSKYDIKCPYSMNPSAVTRHDTANDASAMSEISYMIGNSLEVSYHVAVDDYRAVQGLPLIEMVGMLEMVLKLLEVIELQLE